MLANLLFSLERVAPLFLLLILGWFLGKKDGLSRDFLQAANRFVFRVAIPLNLFCNVAAPNSSPFDLPFMAFLFLATLLSFFAVWGFFAMMRWEKKLIGTLTQGSFRGNLALLGVPMSQAIAGNAAGQKAALAVIAVVPLYNILSVIILTIRGESDRKISLKVLAQEITNNRIVLSVIAAIPLSLLNIGIPAPIFDSLQMVGQIATPLGLISIGGLFRMADATARLRPAVYAASIKLAVLPALALVSAYLAGFRDIDLVVIFLVFASPTSFGTFSMASTMGGDGPLASNILILTTMFSAFTFAAGVFLLRTLGLF